MGPTAQRTVAVIGGGIAGLSAAWELSGAAGGETRVVLFEAGSRFGGKLFSEVVGGREVDLGPDAFVARRPEALALCRELGLEGDLVAPGARRAYVWARGRLRLLPAGLALGVPTRLGPLARSGICSPAGLVGPALDLLRPTFGSGPANGSDPGSTAGTDRAVGEVVGRRLGREVATRLAGPLIGGIHAGTIDTMSSAAVFPALLEADRRPGSLMRALRPTMPRPQAAAPVAGAVAGTPGTGARGNGEAPVFLTLRGGLGRLAETLADALGQRGVELRPDSPVGGLARVSDGDDGRWMITTAGDEVGADGVVIAVPTPAAAGLLRRHDAWLADALGAVTYSSVAIITMRFGDDVIHHPLDGSGFLVPRGDGHQPDPLLTACTWLSSKWPELGRPGDVLLRVSVGRQGDDRHEALGDDELVSRCLAELGPMMGVTGSPLEAVVTRWSEAFPQYPVGHPVAVTAMEAAAARLPAMALAGAALHGVGIPACIGSGRQAARAVLAGVGAGSGRVR
ncbi:MAG TPA: protoporphyrinogen oxidase [Acidimicrobiales bacterium]|nr:protoporphyrinogen oxidase [Acidimicrobiales bacterium]